MLLIVWGWILFRIFFVAVDAGECVHSFAARTATCDGADFCVRPPLAGIRRVDLAADPFGGVDVRCLTSAYPDVAVSKFTKKNIFQLIFVISKKQNIKHRAFLFILSLKPKFKINLYRY